MTRNVLILTIIALSCLSLRAEQFTDSVRVHFRVNQTVIDTLLMENNAAMKGFATRISDLSDQTDKTIKIERIFITGAASPDGSIAFNEKLSRDRAAAIAEWFRSNFQFSDSLAQIEFKGRDWRGLLLAVIGDPDVPNKKEVVELLYDIVKCNSQNIYKPDGVARLKSLRRGVPYRYLLRNHFPKLRASEVFINATVEPKAKTSVYSVSSENSEISEISETPEHSDGSENSELPYSNENPGYIFALKTNMLYDAALIPNLGIEFPIGRHYSVGANWMYAWWQNHDRNRHWRIYGGDINARYYFGNGNRPLTGHHVGLYGQVLVFQVAFGGKGYITGIPGENLWGKPYLGGGIEYGYSKQISRRLNIDFSLGLGYMTGEYRTYRPQDGHYVWQSSVKKNWLGPTKAEISLVWLIGKMQKGGKR